MSVSGGKAGTGHGKPTFTFGATAASSTPFVFGGEGQDQTPAQTPNDTARSKNAISGGSASAVETKVQKLNSIADVALECANFWFPDTVFEKYHLATRFEIGTEKVQFVIHTKVLESRSPGFFDRVVEPVLHGDSGRSVSMNTIPLPQVQHSTFRLFLGWIYQHELIPLLEVDQSRNSEAKDDRIRLAAGSSEPSSEIGDLELVLLYQFAMSFGVYGLANLAVTTLALQNAKHQRTTSRAAIQSILDMVSSDSQKRVQKLLVAEAANVLNHTNLSCSLHDFPRSYCDSILKGVLEKVNSTENEHERFGFVRHVCLAHVHRTSEERLTCMYKLKARIGRDISIPETHNLYRHTGFVNVGEEKLQFIVHKGLICQVSSYFRGAFNGGFLESRCGQIELSEESVKDFSLFLAWLYTCKVQLPSLDDHIDYAGYQSEIAKEMTRLQGDDRGTATELASGTKALALDESASCAKKTEDEEDVMASLDFVARTQQSLASLYAFADRRGVPGLKNDIMTLVAQKREAGWSFMSANPDVVTTAFSSLPSDSPLCQFLIDEAAWCWTNDIDGLENLDEFPSDFNAGLVRAMLRRDKHGTQTGPIWRTNLCHYHIHDKAPPNEKAHCAADLKDWYLRMAEKGTQMEPIAVSN
ncbi:hypothetical protein HII31_06578 [Pseudocercospora fuligena]|uniref:BTB domain-containing protein n=1 Tax=Pseudocercospora fuligena TaxID=685502 RepID=A0A8H6VJ06_9PEZI|nr:hypothetical protein HII31_06578 [Pseudocercospora fuligena]